MHETGSFKYQFPPIVLPEAEAEFRLQWMKGDEDGEADDEQTGFEAARKKRRIGLGLT